MEELGLSAEDFVKVADDGSKQFIGFAESIDVLNASGADNIDIMRVFGQEHGPKLQALVGAGSQAIVDMEEKLVSNGQAAAQAAIKMQGLPGATKELASAWEAATLAFADSFLSDATIFIMNGMTTGLRLLATDGIDFLSEKIDSAKELYTDFMEALENSDAFPFVALRSLGTAFTSVYNFIEPVLPLLLDFGGTALAIGASAAAVSGTASALVSIGVAVKGIGIALTANPIGLTIAAVGAAAYLIYDNWEGITEWWDGLWTSMEESSNGFVVFFRDIIESVTDTWDALSSLEFTFSVQTFTEVAGLVFGLWSDVFDAWINLANFVFGFDIPETGEMISLFVGAYDDARSWWESETDGFEFGFNVPTASFVASMLVDLYKGAYDMWAGFAELAFGVDQPTADEIIDGLNLVVRNIKVWWDEVSIFSIDIDLPNPSGAVEGFVDDVGGAIDNGKSRLKKWGKTLGLFTADGLAEGVKEGSAVVAIASEDMANAPAEVVIEKNDIRSPSRRMRALGGYISEGFALGIEDMSGRAVEAARELTGATLKAFDGIVSGLERQLIGLEEGEEALRRYDLAQRGIVDGSADFIIAEEAKIQSLKDEATATEQAIEAQHRFVGGMVNAVTSAGSMREAISNLGDYMSDWLRNKANEFTTNKIMAVIGMDSSGAEAGFGKFISTAKGMMGDLFSAFRGGMSNLFSSISGLFSGSGGLLSKIGGGISSFFSGSGGLLSKISGGVSSLFGGSGSLASTLSASMSGLFGSGSAISGAIGATTSALGSMGAGLLAAAGPIAAVAAAGYAVYSAFGSSWKTTATGFDVGYSDGSVTGNNFEQREKKKSFWRGTDRAEIMSDLDAGIAEMVGDYFTNINTTMVEQAGLLGAAGADEILAGFAVASERFAGETASEDLAAWLQSSTLQAYQYAFTQLGPEVQSIIDTTVDIEAASLEELEAAFASVSDVVVALTPSLEAAGLMIRGTTDEQAASAYLLSEAMGGTTKAMATLELYASEFVPQGELAAFHLNKANQSLADWNATLATADAQLRATSELNNGYSSAIRDTGDELIATDSAVRLNIDSFQSIQKTMAASGVTNSIAANMMDEFVTTVDRSTGQITINRTALDAYIQTLEAGGQSQQNLADGLMNFVDQLDATGVTTTAQAINLQNYTSSLDLNTDAGRRALQQVDAFAGSMDLMTGRVQVNEAGLMAYIQSLDLGTAAGQDAYASAMALSTALGFQSEEQIRTREQMVAYIDSLHAQHAVGQLTTEQYTEMTAAAMSQLEAIVLVDDAAKAQAETLRTVADSTQLLNLKFDSTSPMALDAANSLVELMGGLDAFNAAANSYYDTFYSAEEQRAIALAQSASAVEQFNTSIELAGGSAITSSEGFRAYVESLDLTTAAGQAAFASAMDVHKAFAEITTDGRAAAEILAQTPDHLLSAAGAFEQNAQDVAASTDEATAHVTANAENQMNVVAGMADSVAADTSAMASNASSMVTEVAGDAQKMTEVVSAETRSMVDQVTQGSGVMSNSAAQNAEVMRFMVSSSTDAMSRHVIKTFGIMMNESLTAVRSAASGWNEATSLIVSRGTAANNAMYSMANSINAVANASRTFYTAKNYIDGSHKTGLDYVPRDGYIAELHRGEMVVPEAAAEQIRNLGPANANISTTIGAPVLPESPVSNGVAELREEIQAMRKETEQLRIDNMKLLSAIANSNSAIATGTQQQNKTLENIDREQERQTRRLAVNA